MTRCRIAALDELWSGDLAACRAGTRRLVVARIGDAVYAYEDRCAHQGVPLSRGSLDGHVLTCSAHHWQYDVRSGCGINPASARLRPVRTELVDGEVYAVLDAEPDDGR